MEGIVMIDYAVPSGKPAEEIVKAIEEEKKICDSLTDWPDPD